MLRADRQHLTLPIRNNRQLTPNMHNCCRNMQLTPAAMEAISEFYTALRANGGHLTLPITVRTLETIIRLSTAAAKARMSEVGAEEVRLSTFAGVCGCCKSQHVWSKQ